MLFRERWCVSGFECAFRSICFYFLCVDVLPACMSVYYVHRSQKNTSDLPELGLQMGLSYYAEAGN